jgi:hypothetical protein
MGVHAAVMIAILLTCAHGENWFVDDIPSPMKEPALCGRPGVQMSIICDVENLLTGDSKNTIEVKASTLWEIEFAVAVGK